MADDNNQASVELDTDGVNEETIHVETPTEEASAFEKKEDVDLGYTDVTNPKSAKELLQEVKKTERKRSGSERDKNFFIANSVFVVEKKCIEKS